VDIRFEKIQNFLIQLATGNFDHEIIPSQALDEIDALIIGINMLGQELKSSQEKHVALFEYSGDAILIYSAALNTFVDSNEMATVLLGHTKEDIRLLTIVDLFPKDEKTRIESKVTYLKSVLQTNFDTQIETNTGNLKYVSFLSKKLPYGAEQYFQISLRDITESKQISNNLVKKNVELKKAQKEIGELSKFPSENPNPILRFNEKLKLVYHNPASSVNFLSDFKIKENNLGDPILKKLLKKAKATGTLKNIIETRNERHYSLTLVYVQEFNYINIYGADITDFVNQVNEKEKSLIGLNDEMEIKVAERTKELRANEVKLEKSLAKEKLRRTALINSEIKLKKSLLREKELGDLKTSFVSIASHQFRTPLAAIQSNSELLQILSNNMDEETSKRYRKVTSRITGEIAKMTELMDDVLILGKLTSRNVDYNPKKLNLVEFCKKLANEFDDVQHDGRSMNIVIIGEPYNVHIDPKLLTHSLSNLFSNAFKYSKGKRNPELAISFKSKEFVLLIKDYGIGIPKDELPKLFQPFFRANNVIEIKGTGLGLSIAKEYTEINKGTLRVNSTEGIGSKFEIYFKK